MTCHQGGIYAITHAASGHRYVGRSRHIPQRWHVHRSRLRHGTHPCCGLQAAWDADGPDAFTWSVLERCAPEMLAARERIHACTATWTRLTKHQQGCKQRGDGIMTASGAASRVPLTVRVDASLRDQAKRAAEERGLSLNDLVIAAISAYCQEAPAPASAEVPVPALGTGSEQADELLRLAELMAADMHLVREVLHALHPALEVEARTRTRSWISRLGIGGGSGER